VLVARGDLDGGRALFAEAAAIEPYCVEAQYNLGLVAARCDDMQVQIYRVAGWVAQALVRCGIRCVSGCFVWPVG
jgi:hypothetical protein